MYKCPKETDTKYLAESNGLLILLQVYFISNVAMIL